jgi:hypothetical protein
MTSYSGAARLCRNCGGPLPEPEVAESVGAIDLVLPSVGTRVCVRCGRCVPAKEPRCAACPASPAPLVVPPRADGAYWVRVTCEYRCAGCTSRAPFHSFAADGRSECSRCGHLQDQALLLWRMVLRHAHAVGDLAGPAPEGRLPRAAVTIGPRNPYRLIGLDVAELEDDRVREGDDTASDLAAGPGHPMCLGCSTPIDAAWKGGDAACATCGATVHGARPARAMPVDRGLVAILRRAPVEARSAAVALRCPTCSGPLTVAEGATQATCKYCQGTSVLARPAARVESVIAERACWMLFTGPSRKRADLESHGVAR